MEQDLELILSLERSEWRKSHPFGFVARPGSDEEGTPTLRRWLCAIPGKANTPFQGGLYKLELNLPQQYPYQPPKIWFTPPLLHPNVYASGAICIEDLGWKKGMHIQEILVTLQTVLHHPVLEKSVNMEVFMEYRNDHQSYVKKIKRQASRMRI